MTTSSRRHYETRTLQAPEGTAPQILFSNSGTKFRAYVGGVGSGKTYAGCWEILKQPRGSWGAVIAPTYPMLRDATLATFLEMTRKHDVLRSFNKAEMRATLKGDRTVLFRSGDNPDRLRGPNLGWFWLDEAALMPAEVWKIMLGRLRLAPGRAWATTTPRGKNWLWYEFTGGGENYQLIRASSKTNPYLPADFVQSLERSYSDLFRRQEVEGEFVDDTADSLLPGAWLDAAAAAPATRSGPTRLAIDLAGGNQGDRTVLVARDDAGILDLRHSKTWQLEETARIAAQMVARWGIAPTRVTFDQIGLGFDFASRLKAVGITTPTAYQAGASGGAKYANLRSASAWLLRMRLDPEHPGQSPFRIPPEWLAEMRDELTALRWTVNNDRKLQLEKKDDLIASLGHSPDFADALIQSFAFPGS